MACKCREMTYRHGPWQQTARITVRTKHCDGGHGAVRRNHAASALTMYKPIAAPGRAHSTAHQLLWLPVLSRPITVHGNTFVDFCAVPWQDAPGAWRCAMLFAHIRLPGSMHHPCRPVEWLVVCRCMARNNHMRTRDARWQDTGKRRIPTHTLSHARAHTHKRRGQPSNDGGRRYFTILPGTVARLNRLLGQSCSFGKEESNHRGGAGTSARQSGGKAKQHTGIEGADGVERQSKPLGRLNHMHQCAY